MDKLIFRQPMDEFFIKTSFYYKISIAIFLLFILDNSLFLLVGKKTEGEVISYIYKGSRSIRYPSIIYPIIQYNDNGVNRKFNGNWDEVYDIGDKVKVIYRPWWPRKAKIYTFWGIAKIPIFQFLLIFVLWTIIYFNLKPSAKRRR